MLKRYRCNECGFELFHPIAALSVSAVGLYDDARFPGRCIVALDAHEEHVDGLSPSVLGSLMADTQLVANAVRKISKATRVNLAILGNIEPHLHVHIVPRGGPWDIAPDKTPWDQPVGPKPLSSSDRERLLQKLRVFFL